MTIAVDFDGTIVEHAYPAIGKELPFAIDTLKRLQENGHRIILWSVREGKQLDEAVEYCHKHGLDFYAVNSDFPNASWSESGVSRKIKADIYIDDRNLGGIPDWGTLYDMITCHYTFNDIIVKAAQGEKLPESFDVYNGTFNRPHRHSKKHGHRRRKRIGPIRWLIMRTREARARFTH